jgi:hypothetical protein
MWNIVGALGTVIWICGIGGSLLHAVLFRTRLLDTLPMNFGLTPDTLRRNFWVGLAAMAVPAALIGWLAGPILSEFF